MGAQAAQAAAARQEAARVASARQEAAQQEAARLAAARQEAARVEAARIAAARQSSVNTNSIVSQVISSLQPLISQTVEGVISTSGTASRTASSSSRSTSASTGSRLSSGTGDIASTFGNGGLTVSVETPDFQFAF